VSPWTKGNARPPSPAARAILASAAADYDRAGLHLAHYWAALDHAALELLKTAAPADEGLERRLRELPRPQNIQLRAFRLQSPTRVLLIGSSTRNDPDRGGYIALFDRGLGHWTLSGSMRVPTNWALWGVWMSGDEGEIAAAWAHTRGTQIHHLRVQVFSGFLAGGTQYEFVDGFPATTSVGIVVKHRREWRPPPDAVTGVRKIGAMQPWSHDSPAVRTLIEMDAPRLLCPSDRVATR
jgi:hypothetical protein